MTAHVVNKNLDPEFPATLSKKSITGILRKKLGFQGVIFSDDMQMEAVNATYGFETLVKKSINAGVEGRISCQSIVFTHDEMIPTKAIEVITKMVENGEISKQRIQQSYHRVIAAKGELTQL